MDTIYHYRFYSRSKPDGRIYVGCSRRPYISERWGGKYTFDTTDTADKILFECDCSKHDADIIETYFIMKYDAVRRGLNKNYGYAMNHWYVRPVYYNHWNQYINDNFSKVLSRLEDWMVVNGFLNK